MHRTHSTHDLRSFAGTCTAVLGAVAVTLALTGGSVSAVIATQQVPLHNPDAAQESSCPDTVDDYWHFVTAPNNNTFVFQSITLHLGPDLVTFTGPKIIPNGTQVDNVFVRVPDQYTLASLTNAGSFADISPATGDVKFVLSHVCDGTGRPTTTTTVRPTTTTTVRPTTTTTVRPTTTTTVRPTTTVDATTTTILDDEGPTTTVDATTTTVLDEGPTTTVDATTTTILDQGGRTTTTVDATTTTTILDQVGPTTTAGPTTVVNGPSTTVRIAQAPPTPGTNPGVAQLPATGIDSGSLMVIGMVLLALGGVMLLGTRRPTDA